MLLGKSPNYPLTMQDIQTWLAGDKNSKNFRLDDRDYLSFVEYACICADGVFVFYITLAAPYSFSLGDQVGSRAHSRFSRLTRGTFANVDQAFAVATRAYSEIFDPQDAATAMGDDDGVFAEAATTCDSGKLHLHESLEARQRNVRNRPDDEWLQNDDDDLQQGTPLQPSAERGRLTKLAGDVEKLKEVCLRANSTPAERLKALEDYLCDPSFTLMSSELENLLPFPRGPEEFDRFLRMIHAAFPKRACGANVQWQDLDALKHAPHCRKFGDYHVFFCVTQQHPYGLAGHAPAPDPHANIHQSRCSRP
jgi:hypothetical protein